MDFSEILINIEHYLSVLIISMAPIIELKGAMPIGLALGLGVGKPFLPRWWVPACRCPF